MKKQKCTCTFAQKVIGDGCYVCNPDAYKKMMDEQRREIEREMQEKDAANLAQVNPLNDSTTLCPDKGET